MLGKGIRNLPLLNMLIDDDDMSPSVLRACITTATTIDNPLQVFFNH